MIQDNLGDEWKYVDTMCFFINNPIPDFKKQH